MKKSYIALLFLAVIVSFFLYILSLLQAFPKIIALPLLFGIIVITLSYFNYKNDSKGFNFKISRKAILSVRKNKQIHLSLQQISTLNLFNKKTRIQSLVFFITFLQIIMLLIHLISLQILVAPLLLVQEMPYLLLLFQHFNWIIRASCF